MNREQANSAIRGFAKRWLPKGWFWRMGTKKRNEGTFGCCPVPKTETKVRSHVLRYQNRNEGTFAKTTPLRNRPFVSQWQTEPAPVTCPPGRVSGQKRLMFLTYNFDPWPPSRETPRSPEGSPAKKIYVYVPFSFLKLWNMESGVVQSASASQSLREIGRTSPKVFLQQKLTVQKLDV